MDIAGQTNIGIGGVRYYLLLVDDFSRYSSLYPLKSRDEALRAFKEFQQLAENIHNTKIKNIRCDNAPEFVKGSFGEHAKACGITFETTVPHTPQQNGVAERHNLTFANMIRALLLDADMNDWFWPLAAQTSVYLKNRVPHKALPPNTSPYQLWYHTKPSLSRIRPFGARCVAKILPDTNRSKFQPKGEVGRFVGYAKSAKGYLFWHPSSRTIKIKRDEEVDFRPLAGPTIAQGGITDHAPLQALWQADQNADRVQIQQVSNVPEYVVHRNFVNIVADPFSSRNFVARNILNGDDSSSPS